MSYDDWKTTPPTEDGPPMDNDEDHIERPPQRGLPAYRANVAVPVEQKLDHQLLGASQAAGVLGMDEYNPPIKVWRLLRGLDSPFEGNEAMEWGKALEPIVRGKYALSQARSIAVPMESEVLDGWLRASPDGYVIAGSAPDAEVWQMERPRGDPFAMVDIDGLLEVKTCSAYRADDWADGVPQKYEIQVRVQMAVCDLPWCDVVCLAGGQRFLGPFRIHRDMALEANILRDLRAFWDLVQSGVEPPIDATESWHQHVSSKMRPSKICMQADDEIRAFLVEWQMARTERKRAEAQEDEIRNQLLLRLSAAGATRIDGGDLGMVTAYKTPDRMDWRAYAEALDAHCRHAGTVLQPIRAQYVRESSTWALRAPASWSKGS